MGMDAIARGGAQRGNLHPPAPPFERPDQAQQFPQRRYGWLAFGRPPGLRAGGAQVRSARQRDAVIALQFHQHLAQNARALSLRLAMQVKCLGQRRGRRRGLTRLAVGAPGHCLQQ